MSWGGPTCGRRACLCTHDHPCDRGWIDLPALTRHGVTYQRVAPCPTCRPATAARLEKDTMRTSRPIR